MCYDNLAHKKLPIYRLSAVLKLIAPYGNKDTELRYNGTNISKKYELEPTGYPVPPSEGTSLNTSGTSGTLSSGPNAVVPPAKRYAPTPAAPAVSAPPRDVEMVRSSSSSGIGSVASSAERVRRLALVKARRETIRQQLALAKADEGVAVEELRGANSASIAGSVGRVAD